MSLSLATVPPYPVPKRPLEVSFTATVGNYVRVWVTDAPAGTAWKAELIDSELARIEVFSGRAGDSWTWTPEKGGVYVFRAQEYTRGGIDTQGGYEGSPSNAPTETKIASAIDGYTPETPLTVYVGQRMETKLGFGSDTATLALWVWNGTIRATTKSVHGEVTPSISGGKTAKAVAASSDPAVLAQLATLADTTVSAAIGEPAAIVADIITNYTAHLIESGVHETNDTYNQVSIAYANPVSPEGIAAAVSHIGPIMRRHMLNDDGTGTGNGAYHEIGGDNSPDLANLPIVYQGNANAMGTVLTALGCEWLSYESHRASTVHTTPDATNTLDPLAALPKLHGLFAQALASPSSASATVNSGASLLALLGGFTETTT